MLRWTAACILVLSARTALAQEQKGNGTSSNIMYLQRDGRLMKSTGTGTVAAVNKKMHYPVGDAAITASVSNKETGSQVLHLQRDGKLVKPTATGRFHEVNKVMHSPAFDSPRRSAPVPQNVKILEVNVLSQHLPKGVRSGDIRHGSSKQLKQAYPWNPIMSESPSIMTMKTTSATKTVDSVIRNANTTRLVNPSVTGKLGAVNKVMQHPVADLPRSSAPVAKKVQKGNGTGRKMLYLQRDGRLTRPSATGTRGLVNKEMNYPVFDSPRESTPGSENVKIVEVNVLSQHLPEGARPGDIKSGSSKQLKQAYPWNPIVAESPAVMNRKKMKTTNTIDSKISHAYEMSGPKAYHYPTENGIHLTELDMKMTNDQYQFYYKGKSLRPNTKLGKLGKRNKRKALAESWTYWTGGIIPFTIDSGFSWSELVDLYRSMDEWMQKTCVQFVPAESHHTDVLRITDGTGCNSFVGRVGGEQTLVLQNGCRNLQIMKHELGHVIGLVHEHQRPDRESYITIINANVPQGRMQNFDKFPTERIQLYNVPYDYRSVMHYGKTAFSADDSSTTMVTTDSYYQDIIGTTSVISHRDAEIVNAMYSCSANCGLGPSCGNGYVDKNCQCVYPPCEGQWCGQFAHQPNSIPATRPTPSRPTPRPKPTVALKPSIKTQERGQDVFVQRLNKFRSIPRAMFVPNSSLQQKSSPANSMVLALVRAISNGQAIRPENMALSMPTAERKTPIQKTLLHRLFPGITRNPLARINRKPPTVFPFPTINGRRKR